MVPDVVSATSSKFSGAAAANDPLLNKGAGLDDLIDDLNNIIDEEGTDELKSKKRTLDQFQEMHEDKSGGRYLKKKKKLNKGGFI